MRMAETFQMTGKMRQGRITKQGVSLRASVSFPRDLYKTLERIARQKKVSLAWVVREAAERYVEDQTPLFREQR